MKPHIKKINGLWHCAVYGRRGLGVGYSARSAFHDWQWWVKMV